MFSKKQAAVYINVSLRTLTRILTRDEIPYHKAKNGRISIAKEDLDKWIADNPLKAQQAVEACDIR